jgi:hypothetical protein
MEILIECVTFGERRRVSSGFRGVSCFCQIFGGKFSFQKADDENIPPMCSTKHDELTNFTNPDKIYFVSTTEKREGEDMKNERNEHT